MDRAVALPAMLMAFGLLASHGVWADVPTDLAEAAHRGDASRVRSLLESDVTKEHVNAAGPSGMTALLWATQHDDATLAELLLEAGADPNVANRYGISPLWLAAINHSAPFVKLLIEHGADPSAALPHGETALMAAARSGDVESIRALLAAGADPDASESSNGETAVMWAAAEDHGDAVRALVQGGADPNARARVLNLAAMNWEQTGMVSTVLPVGGWTALMYAARDDARDGALALAEVGADLDAQDPDGTTALSLAIMNTHYDLAARLLESGADPNVADRSGMTALYTAVDMATLGREIGRPERPQLDELGALEIVRLTLAHGANPNAQLTGPTIPRHHGFPDRSLSAGTTALVRAARSHDLESMRVLLEAGADVNLTQADGSTALFSATAPPPRGAGDAGLTAAKDALLLLLEAGADLHAKTANGETALHRAARQGSSTAVTVLVEQGLPLDVRDAAGKTPLDIVSEPGRAANEDIAALLRQLASLQAQSALTAEDTGAIEGLTAAYARALGACNAEGFADLFAPETGYFASGFRGQIVGRERLIALVQSERHCTAPAGAAAPARPGGANVPAVVVENTADGTRGVVDLGPVGQYQDEYVKTSLGWRFASRTVVVAAEKEAGLDARTMLAIRRLSGAELVDHYVVDAGGARRLRSSGVAISVASGKVTGRAYLADGSSYDDVYEKSATGEWRLEARTHVPAAVR